MREQEDKLNRVPTLQTLRSVSELKYVSVDNVTRYRAIMRFLFLQYQKLNYWLKPEQIYEGVMAWDLHSNYTLEQCQIDLEQLVEWGNLSSRHDGGRSVTIEEYLRKKFQYLITPYSIEIERMLESLETVRGYGGSLEPNLLDVITDTIFQIRNNSGIYKEGEALKYWNTLFESFQKLHETSVDYLASLQTGTTDEFLSTNSFLVYKDSITAYLQDFVQALQRRTFKIESQLRKVSNGVRNVFLEAVIDDEWRIPKLEERVTKEQYYEELHDKWSSLCRWFLGEENIVSESTLLESATKNAIVRMVRSALRIQERRRASISRKKELDYLGQWFYRINELDEAHKLAAYAFGLFAARHLQGEDSRQSDSQETSMWTESPISRTIRSRSRKRNERHETEAMVENDDKKKQLRESFFKQHKLELLFLKKMVERVKVKITDMEKVSASERLQILSWIGRCNSSSLSSFQTPEGILIELEQPSDEQRVQLKCEDGMLELLNYQFYFKVTNTNAWHELLNWLEDDQE